jgi:hypothetical protein
VDEEILVTYGQVLMRPAASGDDVRRTFTEYGVAVVIVVARGGVDVVSSEPRPLLSLCARLPLLDFDVTNW